MIQFQRSEDSEWDQQNQNIEENLKAAIDDRKKFADTFGLSSILRVPWIPGRFCRAVG